MSRRHRDAPPSGLLLTAAVVAALVTSIAMYYAGSTTGVDREQVASTPIPNEEAATAEPSKSAKPDAQDVVAGTIVVRSPRAPSLSRSASRPATSGAPSPTASESTSPGESNEPEPEPSSPGEEAAPAQRALTLANSERAEAGCPALVWNATLGSVAAAHSADMAANNYFDHTGLDGRSAAERITDAGFSFSRMAENIAAGQPSADAAMVTWMDSSGHRSNLLNCELTQTGIGVATDGDSEYGTYWTQVFATPSG